MGRLIRFVNRLFQSILFLLKNPSSVLVDVNNATRIQMGMKSRIGMGGRAYTAPGSSIKIGSYVWTGRNVELQTWHSQNIELDDYVSVQDACKVLGDVKIGAYSTLAPNIFVSSGTHQFKAAPEKLIKVQDQLYPDVSEPVEIGEDVWIGTNVFIKNGITIGRGAVIGANAVVLKNIAPYSIVGGIPAKEIGSRLHFSPPQKLDSSNEHDHVYFYSGFDHMKKHSEGMRLRKQKGVIYTQRPEKDSKLKIRWNNLSQHSKKIEVKTLNESRTLDIHPGETESEITLSVLSQKHSNTHLEISLLCLEAEVKDIYVRGVTIN